VLPPIETLESFEVFGGPLKTVNAVANRS
jgi:hypothetical protein